MDSSLERRRKIGGGSPKPTITFNTNDKSLSGFDGCNNFKGTYTFSSGKLNINVLKTKKACLDKTDKSVSAQFEDIFFNGAEVVETSFMGAHVLMLKNKNAELRLGPSDQVK